MCPWKRDHINVKNYVSEIDAYLFEIKKKNNTLDVNSFSSLMVIYFIKSFLLRIS